MAVFRLDRRIARWLNAESPESNLADAPDWDLWLLRRMSQGQILDVGGVLVDRAVLRQRFACVSQRCSPGQDRGRSRSCCADVLVPLSKAEDRALASRGLDLLGWLKAREPRLAQLEGRAFYRQQGEPGLARPGGRCVFSQLDQRGRIRCRLHAYAKQAEVDRADLQPVSCRLFPLIVIDRGDGRVVLTVVASHTRQLVSAHPVNRYPCLSDESLPPLYQAMRADLDLVFGSGFARALSRAAAGSASAAVAAEDP
jgi:hypothetical protein